MSRRHSKLIGRWLRAIHWTWSYRVTAYESKIPFKIGHRFPFITKKWIYLNKNDICILNNLNIQPLNSVLNSQTATAIPTLDQKLILQFLKSELSKWILMNASENVRRRFFEVIFTCIDINQLLNQPFYTPTKMNQFWCKKWSLKHFK